MSERLHAKVKIQNNPLPPVNEQETNKNFWMARLYLLRTKIGYSSVKAKENYHWGKPYRDTETERTLKIARQADRLVNRPDFEKKGKLDEKYQKLLEQFAQAVSTTLLVQTPEAVASPYMELAQNYDKKVEELKEKAENISSKHNSPRERAQYAIFAVRSFLKDFAGLNDRVLEERRAPKIGISMGMEQLMKDSIALDKEKGKYRINLGDGEKPYVETKSRLEALSDRNFWDVTPVPPTRPFLTRGINEFVKFNKQIRTLMKQEKIGVPKL